MSASSLLPTEQSEPPIIYRHFGKIKIVGAFHAKCLCTAFLSSLIQVAETDLTTLCRFNYSREFLRWALHPPGYRSDWHIGIRVADSKKLVAFISAVPSLMNARDKIVKMVDINFLCIHKKLRSKRLAPVLIKARGCTLSFLCLPEQIRQIS